MIRQSHKQVLRAAVLLLTNITFWHTPSWLAAPYFMPDEENCAEVSSGEEDEKAEDEMAVCVTPSQPATPHEYEIVPTPKTNFTDYKFTAELQTLEDFSFYRINLYVLNSPSDFSNPNMSSSSMQKSQPWIIACENSAEFPQNLIGRVYEPVGLQPTSCCSTASSFSDSSAAIKIKDLISLKVVRVCEKRTAESCLIEGIITFEDVSVTEVKLDAPPESQSQKFYSFLLAPEQFGEIEHRLRRYRKAGETFVKICTKTLIEILIAALKSTQK